MRVTPKVGHALGMVGINEEDLLVITVEGKVIGIPTTQVRSSGRATQGVRIIKLEDKDRACSIAKVRESYGCEPRHLLSKAPGTLFGSAFLLCRGPIALDIRSAWSSTGCCSTASAGSCRNIDKFLTTSRCRGL